MKESRDDGQMPQVTEIVSHYLINSRKRYLKAGQGQTNSTDLVIWTLHREVEFQKMELDRVKSVVRYQKWAMTELCDYLDAELRPGQLTSWTRYRRLVARLKDIG